MGQMPPNPHNPYERLHHPAHFEQVSFYLSYLIIYRQNFL